MYNNYEEHQTKQSSNLRKKINEKECKWTGLWGWRLHGRARQNQNAFVRCFLLCTCEPFVDLGLERRPFCEIRGILQSEAWFSAYFLPGVILRATSGHDVMGLSGLIHSAKAKRLKTDRGTASLTVHLDATLLLPCSGALFWIALVGVFKTRAYSRDCFHGQDCSRFGSFYPTLSSDPVLVGFVPSYFGCHQTKACHTILTSCCPSSAGGASNTALATLQRLWTEMTYMKH